MLARFLFHCMLVPAPFPAEKLLPSESLLFTTVMNISRTLPLLGPTEGEAEAETSCESENSREERSREEACDEKGVREESHPREEGGQEVSHVEGY